jgi:hypothetical protein
MPDRHQARTDTDRPRRLRPGALRVDRTGDCWKWQGATRRAGYGVVRIEGQLFATHRLVFALFNGPIPEGMTVDHLCFEPSCLNPDHMRLLTWDENRRNQRRAYATHCVNGHPFDEANTVLRARGHGRECRACNTARKAAARRRLDDVDVALFFSGDAA